MQILKNLSYTVLFLAAACVTVSCENVVEVPIPAHTPKLAVRCTISNQTLDTTYYRIYPESQPYVGQSRSTLETDPPGITNAQLVITDASGHVVETFEHGISSQPWSQGSGYYLPVSKFTPEPGKYYKLTASAPGFETVTGELTLPAQPQGITATFVKKLADPFNVTGRLSFTIPDKGAEENFYFVQVFALDSLRRVIPFAVVQEEKDEDGLESGINDVYLSQAYGTIYPFDDKTFNGRNFTTAHNINFYTFQGGLGSAKAKYLRAVVGSITKDTFLFHKSVDLYYETHDNPFAEPTRIQGNLKNGYGYFGGHANAYVDIELPK